MAPTYNTWEATASTQFYPYQEQSWVNCTTSASASDEVWYGWVKNDSTNADNYYRYDYEVVQVSQAELAAREESLKHEMARRRQQEIETTRRRKIEEERRMAADKRSKELLMKVLEKKQLERFLKDECIPVDTAKGNKYLIRKGRAANVDVLDKNGKKMHKLCAHPKDHCPDYDTMLAQLMYLKSNEDAFLQMANVHPA